MTGTTKAATSRSFAPSAWPTLDEQRAVIVGQRTRWLVPYRARRAHVVQQTVPLVPRAPLTRTVERRVRDLRQSEGILRNLGRSPTSMEGGRTHGI